MVKLKNGGKQPDAGCFCLKCPPGIIILALIFNLQLNNQFYVKDSCKQISCMCPRQYILMGGGGQGEKNVQLGLNSSQILVHWAVIYRAQSSSCKMTFVYSDCSPNNLHALQCGLGRGPAG